MILANWARYHLWPQLGLALIVPGGLCRWGDTLVKPVPGRDLSARQAQIVGLLLAAFFVTQLPRGLTSSPFYDPQQRATLLKIEAMDARCRREHIAAAAAREVLDKLKVPHCHD